MTEDKSYLEPVDGKFVFQIDKYMRIRFNADGWVEEIGRGGDEDPMGTPLHGKPSTKLDTIYARRYYDLYSRIVIIDIFTKDQRENADGIIPFRELEPESRLYERLQKIIEIANVRFELNLKPLG